MRKATISESARRVNSSTRCAAASVSFMTCGRGRAFGLKTGVGDACLMSLMWSIPTANQCWFISRFAPYAHNASPHIQDEARLVAHPLRRPDRFPDDADIDHAHAWNACDRILHHGRQLASCRAIRRGQRHHNVDRTIILDVDPVDQAELVNVG